MKKLFIAFFMLFFSSVLLAFLFANEADWFSAMPYHLVFSAFLAFVLFILDHNRRTLENTAYNDTILLNEGESLDGIKNHIINTTDWKLEKANNEKLIFHTDVDVSMSMGEEICLSIIEKEERKTLKITSRSLLPTRIFDYGINGRNVKAMYTVIKGAFISR